MHEASAVRSGHRPPATPAAITADLLEKHRRTGGPFWVAAGIFLGLAALGVVGVAMRLSGGVRDTAAWGYYAAAFAFLLTTAQAAPMVAIAPRLVKAHWQRPISRIAELFALVGLVNLLLFIPLLWVLPGLDNGRRTLWFFEAGKVPRFSPHVWATLALVSLVICGLALLWVSALPDLAAARDGAAGRRRRLFARLARGWHGTSRQWHMQYHRLGILGAFYFMMLVFVHFLISVDFCMALVPGWIDSVFPVAHAANALQAGAATVLLTMFFLRRFGGYRDYLGLEQFWGLGKLLFVLSLLWFWLWFSAFIVYWYTKRPAEQAVMELLTKGPYLRLFVAVFLLNFAIPLFAMIWNPLRKSIWGPTLIAAGVLVGTFLDRVRLYVGAFSVADQSGQHALTTIPAARLPGLADVLLVVGALGASALVYLLATRLVPPISIWEQKELLLYRLHKPFHRTEVTVLAKRD